MPQTRNQDRKKEMDALKAIQDNPKDNLPYLKASTVTMAGMLMTLMKSTEAQDQRIEKVEKDVSALLVIKDEVAKLRDEVGKWGSKIEEVDSKLEVLSDLDTNIKNIQKDQKESVKRFGEAADLMDTERVKMEEARLDREKADVASCLIVMGLEKGETETYKQLEQKVIELFRDGLGLTNDIIGFSRVERFGPGKRGPAAAAAGPERPPLVRITLMEPSMKSPIFGSVANLRGKEEFARVSVQNEVPKSMMEEYKVAVNRAKELRQDCNVKTRVSWAKGPVTVLVKLAGWPKFLPEDKLNQKQTDEMEKAKK